MHILHTVLDTFPKFLTKTCDPERQNGTNGKPFERQKRTVNERSLKRSNGLPNRSNG